MNDISSNPELTSTSQALVPMERHVGPFADGTGVVVRRTSDAMFGPDGLGFGKSVWMKLVSWLARSGISEQTGSRPNETIVKSCTVGWGQGAFSSRVFRGDGSADVAALERLIANFQRLALVHEGHSERITARVVAAYVNTQSAQAYSTHTGPREARTLRERLSNRFRAHIQWQSLVALCGHVDQSGHRVLTRLLLTRFFMGERLFFADVVERRRQLRSGELRPGTAVGLLEFVDENIDRVATDQSYQRNKSSLRVLLTIVYHMTLRTGT